MKTPKVVAVTFDLPFCISVEDSLNDINLRQWLDAFNKEEELPINFYAPKSGNAIYLPDKLGKPYIVKTGKIRAYLYFLRRVNNNRSIVLFGELIGDKYGKASFSTVQIVYNLNSIPKKKQHQNAFYIIDFAIKSINRFLEHYRILTGRFYINNITKEIVQDIHATWWYDDGSTHTGNFGSGIDGLHTFPITIDRSIDNKLRKDLRLGNSPSINGILYNQIKDHFFIQNYRSAVLECGVFFEVAVKKFIIKKFKDQGLSEQDAIIKLKKPNGRYLDLDTLLSTVMVEAAGFNFKISQEYQDWNDNVRIPRNEIAHGGIDEVQMIDAQKAISSTEKGLSIIYSYL